jgi:hypothetical protein
VHIDQQKKGLITFEDLLKAMIKGAKSEHIERMKSWVEKEGDF